MNWPYLTTKAKVWLILYTIWVHIALVVLIAGLVSFLNGSIDWWLFGGICAIPVAFPILRFVFRCFTSGFLVGLTSWNVTVDDNGHVNASHDGWLFGILTAIFAIALAVVSGPFVLGIFIIFYIVIILRALFARG